MAAQRTPKGFAVVDFETTGINPTNGDRAIEIGIVHVAPDGTLEDEAETLIRVQRDLGDQHLHHIHAADLMYAPDFAGISRELRDWLDGYVFVAHNAVFDSRFLNAEYNRLGYVTPVDRTTAICTLRLSNRFLGLRSLKDCCHELGIHNPDAHSALGDAHATALLLSGFLHGIPDWEGWKPALQMAAEREWPVVDERPHPWVPRQSHVAKRPASPFLDRLRSGNPGGAYRHDDVDDAAAEYLAMLDQCLIDARLSEHEKDALVDTADALGLTRENCMAIHRHYFNDVADEAWLDGRMTDDEERELRQVGTLLSIDEETIDHAVRTPPYADTAGRRARGRHARPSSDAAESTVPHDMRPSTFTQPRKRGRHQRVEPDDLTIDAQRDIVLGRPLTRERDERQSRPRFRLHRGDRVVLTGSMSRPRDEWIYLLESLGLVVWPSVTMQVRLVIAADVDSESSKARKAREYGIPIVDEEWLAAAIDNGLVEE